MCVRVCVFVCVCGGRNFMSLAYFAGILLILAMLLFHYFPFSFRYTRCKSQLNAIFLVRCESNEQNRLHVLDFSLSFVRRSVL